MTSTLQTRQEVSARTALRAAQIIETVALTGVAQTIYTAGRGDFVIEHLRVCNTSGSAQSYSIHIVPSGGTAATGNAAALAAPLAANEAATVPALIGERIPPGYSLQALCSASVNIGGNGYEEFGEYA